MASDMISVWMPMCCSEGCLILGCWHLCYHWNHSQAAKWSELETYQENSLICEAIVGSCLRHCFGTWGILKEWLFTSQSGKNLLRFFLSPLPQLIQHLWPLSCCLFWLLRLHWLTVNGLWLRQIRCLQRKSDPGHGEAEMSFLLLPFFDRIYRSFCFSFGLRKYRWG